MTKLFIVYCDRPTFQRFFRKAFLRENAVAKYVDTMLFYMLFAGIAKQPIQKLQAANPAAFSLVLPSRAKKEIRKIVNIGFCIHSKEVSNATISAYTGIFGF